MEIEQKLQPKASSSMSQVAAEERHGSSAPTADSSSSEAHGASDDDDDLVSKLPTREGWIQPLVLYNKYWLCPEIARNILRLQDIFKPRRDDTIVATSPKCGTTWMKAIAFAITNRSRYGFGDHPLLSRHPHEVVPSMEYPWDGDLTSVETLQSPRLLATHMPLSLLPKSIASCGCRIVYMCREPKDAFVSRWHFDNRNYIGHNMDMEAFFNTYSQGFQPYGPFWDHHLEYWKESVANPGKVLFLKYEDMISEPVKYVTRLATFLGVPFSVREEEDGVPEKVVTLCSFEKLSSLHVNQTGDFVRRDDLVLESSAFFRKGKVGDWANHMSQEMGRNLDRIVEEKLRGSGLVL